MQKLTSLNLYGSLFLSFVSILKRNQQALDQDQERTLAQLGELFSRVLSEGNVCISLEDLDKAEEKNIVLTFVETFNHSPLFSSFAESFSDLPSSPFVWDAKGQRLYLHRDFIEELELAKKLLVLKNAPDTPISDETRLHQEKLFNESQMDEIQKKAVEMALKQQLTIIYGGPGTGKTTTVVHLLECLKAQNRDLIISLAAPTGKATARMLEAIEGLTKTNALSGVFAHLKDATFSAKTIHKWLFTPDGDGVFPCEKSPLQTDVLIIDEASMLDTHLATKLFKAISPSTKVILLGDKFQLAAVGPGAILAELTSPTGALAEHSIELIKSRRFDEKSPIGQLAQIVKAAKKEALSDFVKKAQAPFTLDKEACFYQATSDETPTLTPAAKAWLNLVYGPFEKALRDYSLLKKATDQQKDLALSSLFEAINSARALCANREGPFGVNAINDYVCNRIRALTPDSTDTHFFGQVIIVRQNDTYLGLYNGDMAVILPDEALGGFVAHFANAQKIPVPLLPRHQSAFALTIHQSQGSEFDHVGVFMPPSTSPLATRELLYTGITRAKKTLTIFASEAALERSSLQSTHRMSGLASRLTLLLPDSLMS